MKKIISTFLYTLSSIFVFFIVMFLISILEKTFVLHTLYWTGDIDAILLILFFGIFVFSFFTKKLNYFEGNNLPTIIDHIRYNIIFYIVFTILLIESILSGTYISNGIGSSFYAVMFGIFITSIVVNAITLTIIYKSKIKK